MKHLLLFLTALILAMPVRAQKIRFTDPSNMWSVHHHFHPQRAQPPDYTFSFSYTGDTSISGLSYRVLRAGSNWVDGYTSAAIREDTLLGKVYLRFMSGLIRKDATDTAEHVLYDYNLRVNDTFFMDHSRHYFAVVSAMDSVQIAGAYHRVWHFRKDTPTHFNLYVVIEGIGTLTNPLWPAAFEVAAFSGDQVRCFVHQGGQPVLSHPLAVAPVGWDAFIGIRIPDSFSNTGGGCQLSAAAPAAVRQQITLYPHPGGEQMVLRFAVPIQEGALTVWAADGRKVAAVPLSNSTGIAVGRLLRMPGLYFYSITDDRGHQRYTGRLVLE